MTANYETIPGELKDLRRWVNYMVVQLPGKDKPSKPPINPRTGRGALTTAPDTWGTYDEALQGIGQAAQTASPPASGISCGIGFVLGMGYFGVDLDNVLRDGVLDPAAAAIVDLLDSYTEISPSGTGVHVICRGTIPANMKRNGIELYSNARYFTVTGNIYGKPRAIETRTDAAAAIYAENRPVEPPQAPRQDKPIELTDRVKQALTDSKETLFKRLWAGDYSNYPGTDGQPDHSKGDLALCMDLARLTGGNAALIDSYFRGSGMYRADKWDARHSGGGQTYGEMTINTALQRYTPDNAKPQEGQTMGKDKTPDNMLQYMQTQFDNDSQRFKAYRQLKTGFAGFDKVSRGIMPGFHVLGAISGGGKTTFALQMADNIAAQRQHVLYFALEQGQIELVSKSLSRLTRAIDKAQAVESFDIRLGDGSPIVQQAKARYMQTIGPHMHIIPCGFNAAVETITDKVKAFIADNPGPRPVVFVDYLQAVQAERQGAREGVDEVLGKLKGLQTEYDLIMILLSLLNRSNYMYPVDFTSFKESGKIEATADIAWGLQLQAIRTEKIFETDDRTAITQKRKVFDEENSKDPRRVELVAIKTRYGPNYHCRFDYHTAFDTFDEDTEYTKAQNKPKPIRL